jgi:hypothetical protein
LPAGSPILLDLDRNGISTSSVLAGTKFDLNADGNLLNTGWVGSGDGLLALDRNQDGKINDGSELFGTATQLADCTRAAHGYAALAELDSNGDHKIDQQDAAYAQLRVWVDANQDGVSELAELKTLQEVAIASLDTTAQASSHFNQGNWVGLTSSYTSLDGTRQASADVWFVTANTGKQTNTAASTHTEVAISSNVQELAQSISSFVQQTDNMPVATQLPSIAPTHVSAASAFHHLAAMTQTLAQSVVQFNHQAPLQAEGTEQTVRPVVNVLNGWLAER